MEIFTIGFTQSTAAHFFGRLKRAGIRRLLDVRLNNRSQLAGFAKRDDLAYFPKELCDAEYVHEPLLAPEQAMLDAYKKSGGDWSDYEAAFMKLMREREIENELSPKLFEMPTTLLCSEATADNCHRRLVVEYLQQHWPDVRARTPVAMRICINHLTRMQAGCICAAGIDEASGLHIRPSAGRQLSTSLLAEHGGPLALGSLVDLGPTQFAGRMPEIEDRRCDFDHCRAVGQLTSEPLLTLARGQASDSLHQIFGPELQLQAGRTFVLPEHRGLRSLGCWWTSRSRLILNEHGKPQFVCQYEQQQLKLPITDIRLFRGNDFRTDYETFELFQNVLAGQERTLVSVGLSRPFRKSNSEPAYHWLQVNNVLHG